MTLQDWGLSQEQIAALSPAQRADYDAAMSEFNAAIASMNAPWSRLSGLTHPVSADGIRAIARSIREDIDDDQTINDP